MLISVEKRVLGHTWFYCFLAVNVGSNGLSSGSAEKHEVKLVM